MSKFPSIQNVVNATKKTILRFPLETITTIIGTFFAILLIDTKYNNPCKELYAKAIMSSSLCLVLLLSISLFFLTSKKNKLYRFLTSLLLAGFAIAFVFNFHKEPTDLEIQQFLVLNISLHLLVSFAGFLPKKYNQDEFWEFNKQLFLRILTSTLYSIVLYSGLALAILALKELFKIEFDGKIYGYLFFGIAGIFNTLFFLNGVPEINNEKSLQLSYPNGLKNFTQYILLPLIILYLIILIGYETKILITFSLPTGWVSYLVLVFAIFGILSFLLVFPIASQTGNLWIKTFNRWFYFLLLPLLGLLFWAILYRIGLYGFTHERYYVLLLAIWLMVVVMYFLIQKEPKIKFIPISMCVAGLLSISGPQSADSISKNSQLGRFESYMKKSGKEKLTFKQEKDISSIVDFLQSNYGVEALVIPETKEKLSSLLKKDKKPSSLQIMKALGVEYRYRYSTKNDLDTYFYYDFYEDTNNTVDNIHGYDLAFTISSYSDFNCKDCVQIDKISYTLKSVKTKYGIDLHINKDTIVLPFFDFINKTSRFDQDSNRNRKITQIIEHSKYQILLNYINVNGNQTNSKKTIENYTIKVLVKFKE